MNSTYKDDTPKARLPLEVILSIIENLIPGDTQHRPILPASHVVTKTLLSLTLVSRAVYPLSSRLLWQNCLRIESKESLRLFRDFISRESIVTGRKPCDAYGSTRLFLSPFSSYCRHSPVSGFIDGESLEEVFPPVYSPIDPNYPELQDYDTIEAVNEVLITIAPVLKTIIVDMPLRSLYPEDDDTGIRKLLREGFEALVNVEELVSINDELYLDTKEDQSEPEVWTKWPKLKRLALYNVVTELKLWTNMTLCPQLERAVLSRSDCSEGGMSDEDIKDQWSRAWTEATSQEPMSFEDRVPYQGREVFLAFCDWESSLPKINTFSHWGRLDPDNLIWIVTVPFDRDSNLPLPGYGHHYPDVPKTWIRRRALRGSLWDDLHAECCDFTSPID